MWGTFSEYIQSFDAMWPNTWRSPKAMTQGQLSPDLENFGHYRQTVDLQVGLTASVGDTDRLLVWNQSQLDG